MAEDNKDAFQVIDDPFHPGVRRGIVKAVNPDVSLIHGLAADRQGNSIIAPPYSENIYGANARKQGAMVTVERLVSTEFIRKYSHMVRVPAHVVLSVYEVPFGAHPHGMGNIQIPGWKGMMMMPNSCMISGRPLKSRKKPRPGSINGC